MMPYFLPSGAILRMYSIGSRNSSSVGRNVGASWRPNILVLFWISRAALACPRRSTVLRSSAGARRALRGTMLPLACLSPPAPPALPPPAEAGPCEGAAAPPMRPRGWCVEAEPLAGLTRKVLVWPAAGPPPPLGGTTISQELYRAEHRDRWGTGSRDKDVFCICEEKRRSMGRGKTSMTKLKERWGSVKLKGQLGVAAGSIKGFGSRG